jgi:hypothetical protein
MRRPWPTEGCRAKIKQNTMYGASCVNYMLRVVADGPGKDKGKAIPLMSWVGPEGSRRLRLPDFKTIGT